MELGDCYFMRKINIFIENGDDFEIMADGDIVRITIETTKGEYTINKIKKNESKTTFTEDELEDIFSKLRNIFG